MNRDHVIEKINAYRKLLDLTLKTVTKDDAVQGEVQAEFKQWVEDQLNALMGTPTGSFSDSERTVLRAFAAKLLNKTEAKPEAQAAPAQAPKQAVKQPVGITDRDRESIARARPLRELREPSKDPDPLVRKLEEMDRSGPNF